MARRKFEDGFKERAVAYCHEHPEKTMKACAADLDIGYSTLRRWMTQVDDSEQKSSNEEVVVSKQPEQDVADVATEEQVPEETIVAESDDADHAADDVEAPDAVENVAEESEPAEVPEEHVVTPKPASDHEADVAKAEEKEGVDDDDDYLFSSIGVGASRGTNSQPHDEDYDLRCKSHPSSYKNFQHMAGDRIVSVSAQIGNIIEDLAGGMSNVSERLGLYKKRHDLKKEKKLIKKEKQKRQKR